MKAWDIADFDGVRNPSSGARLSASALAYADELVAARGGAPPDPKHLLQWSDQIEFRLASPEKRQEMLAVSGELFRRQRPKMWTSFAVAMGNLLIVHESMDLAIFNLVVLAGMAYYFPRAMRRDRVLAKWLAKS